ncbi:MAG: glycosyltransferase family 4 protein [Nitrospinae bacterium]|nr:glycosyltransferase family 4 protein [Nitrospinota bacterium]
MKIVFLLPHVRISGGVKALLEYANRLQGMGHGVRLIVPGRKPKWYRPDLWLKTWAGGTSVLPPESVDWFYNRIPVETVPDFHPKFLPDADVLVASSWQTAAAAASLPDSKGRKFYFIQHHESLWTRDAEKARRTYTLPFAKIVISTWLKEVLAQTYGQESQVFVTPVDRELFDVGEKTWNRPRRICLLHHDYDWKGFADGIAAVRRVRERGLKATAVVFGEKAVDAEPIRRAAGFDVEYHYRPAGERLRSIYAGCDIYLCPSWHEGLGMPAMEAMACRCALATTDTGGCRDYAIHGRTALVSQPRDVEGLAKNLSALVSDERLLRELSENGYRKIQEFRWEDNCRELVRLFERSL